MGARRRPARGQSVTAARCAVISSLALLGCLVAQGSLRALLAFVWVTTMIAGIGLEWLARRRVREAPAAATPKRAPRSRPPGAA